MPETAQAEAPYKIKLSRIQRAFVESTAEIIALVGPMGEGKTFAGGSRILRVASMLPEGDILRGAMIRDKGSNIQDHTVPSLLQSFGQITNILHPRQGMFVWETGNMHMDMFGIDSLSDLGRIGQGPEYDFIWLEEPAPVMSTDSAGIRREVFELGYARLRGGKKDAAGNRYKWMQFTMNPAEEEHWTYDVLEANPLPGTEVFYLLNGENPYLTADDRRRRNFAFRNRPDLAARYEKGEWGSVKMGVAVTPEYKEERHRSLIDLEVLPNVTRGYRLWDGWHHPCCIVVQPTPSGRLMVLDTFQGNNIGVKQLIDTRIKADMSGKYKSIRTWRDMGDETMCTPDQSDRSMSAAKVIERELGTVFEPCTNDWNMRRESLRNLLNLGVDGESMLLLSRHEKILHKALNGGWHYPKNPSGIVGDSPVKDMASHPGDALASGAIKLTPWIKRLDPPKQIFKQAKSYAVS